MIPSSNRSQDGHALSPHIYLSVLPFTPEGSAIKQLYGHLSRRVLIPHISSSPKSNVDTPPYLSSPDKPSKSIHCVAFLPGDRVLMSASDDGTVIFWDAVSGGPVDTIVVGNRGASDASEVPDSNVNPRRPIRHASASPDGAKLAFVTDSGDVYIYDGRTRTLLHRLDTEDHVFQAEWLPGGYLVTCSPSQVALRKFESDSEPPSQGEPLQDPYGDENAYGPYVGVATLQEFVVVRRRDGSLVLWDTHSRACIEHLSQGECTFVAPATMLLMMAHLPPAARALLMATITRCATLSGLFYDSGYAWTTSSAASPSSSCVIDGTSARPQLEVIDAISRECVWDLPSSQYGEPCAFSHDGARLAMGHRYDGGKHQTVCLIDIDTLALDPGDEGACVLLI